MEHGIPQIFIGSGEASVLERKTFIYSIKKNTPRPVKIYVFNGTHNALETEGEAPRPLNMSLRAKYRNITEFSNYRYLIPELCGYQGRAIYVDSDMICLKDIYDLFDAPMNGADFLALQNQFDTKGRWGLSVVLFDCTRCRFDLERYCDEIDRGMYSYNDLHQMTPSFLAQHPFKIGPIDPLWNSYDYYDEKTKLIHYTNLFTQPWKFRGHPYGKLWFKYLDEAKDAGYLSDADIALAVRRAYVRPDVTKGNTLGLIDTAKLAAHELWASAKERLHLSR